MEEETVWLVEAPLEEEAVICVVEVIVTMKLRESLSCVAIKSAITARNPKGFAIVLVPQQGRHLVSIRDHL